MNKEISKTLAKILLELGAIKLNVSEPFRWASGYQMVIYNNNRELLCKYDYRMIVAEAFSRLLSDTSFDCIVGTSLAGIPHAATLATLMGKPLVIFHEEKPYMIRPGKFIPSEFSLKAVTSIVSTAPWGIASGIGTANTYRIGYMYVRPNKKDHGLHKRIEGKPFQGEKVSLVFVGSGNIRSNESEKLLCEEEGLDVVSILYASCRIEKFDFTAKRAIVIEDLISTGRSSYTEVEKVRKAGGLCDMLFSIFSYDFPESAQLFKEGGCNVQSLLSYADLMAYITEENTFSPEVLQDLNEWSKDPWEWGEKRGFPRIVKQQM